MTPLSSRALLTLAVALVVPAVASLWLMAAPQSMTSSTYALAANAAGRARLRVAPTGREQGLPASSLGELQHEQKLAPAGATRS